MVLFCQCQNDRLSYLMTKNLTAFFLSFFTNLDKSYCFVLFYFFCFHSGHQFAMQMQVQQKQFTGLVADLMPNIRLMRFVGHFLNKFSNGSAFLNKVYSMIHLILMLLQFICIIVNLALNTSEVNELTANTVTTLHFTHTITKFCYLAINNKGFYRTFNIWNQSNSHPLFAESDARYHSIALAKMRKNLYMITGLTLATVACKFINKHTALLYGV